MHDMGDSSPQELFTYVAGELGRRHVAFVFVREIEGNASLFSKIRESFGGPVVANEEMGVGDGQRLIEHGAADAIAFGRNYIANPDLVERIANDSAWNEAEPSTFSPHPDRPHTVGYTDYPAMVN